MIEETKGLSKKDTLKPGKPFLRSFEEKKGLSNKDTLKPFVRSFFLIIFPVNRFFSVISKAGILFLNQLSWIVSYLNRSLVFVS